MCTPQEIQYIVDSLNQSPFEKELTLLAFDELLPQELLQHLNDILGEISTDNNIDLRDEQPGDTAQRMVDFLWIIKYRPSYDVNLFRQGLATGDKTIVHPIMFWLLQRIPELRKRAYLARFLLNIEVPPDMQNDDVYMQYKEKQDEFKEAHKEVDKIRDSGFEPSSLKKECAHLEEEKIMLIERLNKIKKKVQDVANLDKYLDSISGLRKEMDEEEKLNTKLEEQRNQLTQSKQKYQRVLEGHKEMKVLASTSTSEGHIQRLIEDAKTNKFILEEKLPAEISEKQEWCNRLKRVLDEPILTDSGRQAIVMDITNLRKDIKLSIEKRDAIINPVDDKLNLFRQQAVFVEKKREEKEARLKDILEERNELEQEVKQKLDKMEAEGSRILRGEELDNYVANLRKKTQLFRKYKAELADLRTEYGILSRTQEILSSRDVNLREFLDEMAAKKGVKGYEQTVEKMEVVSSQKSELDEQKAKTLEEISKIVTEINNSIKERRDKLTPQVKELRAIRQEHQELEVLYTEKKTAYESSKMALESEKAKLEQERELFEDDCTREESKFHYLNCMSCVLDAQLHKANEKFELHYRDGNSFKDVYNKKIAEQEQLSKILREKQKEIKVKHEPSLKQRDMFTDLRKILTQKLELYSRALGQQNPLELENGAVDRLVL